ncbi:MAG: sugar phosphate isomerase/epimerase [Clostridia bacterium]|nr:sugar phosphate isomerase/epimerase [Clostridia bacterium]
MKIGVCVNFTSMEEMPEKLAKVRAQGFDSCQLIAWAPTLWTAENAATLKALFTEYGVHISAFWCGWEGPQEWNFYEGQTTLGLVPPEYRDMRVKNLCDGADFAKAMGITDVVTHMGFIPENPNDPQYVPFCDAVRTVALHLKENEQYLLFESGQETPVTMLRCFETVGTDNLGVNLDTANVILYGRANPVDALYVIGKYVRGLHAKDGCYPTNGHDLGEEKAIGQGMVDFPTLIRKLHELGYTGYITIEREIFGEQQALDICAARDYLKSLIDEVTGGALC